MAPALPACSPQPRRRAFASVLNLAAPMEDDMGLQQQPSLVKDSQEMEQILSDLGGADLAQTDILQAIKTLETGGDNLSTGDPDVIFPLSGFDLAETADSEGDAAEDKIKMTQVRLEKRCKFLERRLRILQARAMGKRISEEVSQIFEKANRAARKDGSGRPMGLKTLLKKLETTATLQASAASRPVVGPKYYNAGSSRGDASRSATIGIPSGTLTGLEDTAGALRSHLSVVKHELDSDATESSSGAESNDEAVTYSNPHQEHMAIERRALWSYQRTRASIASRWGWLQAQVQELEYKIRQHTELHKRIRDNKGAVEFEGEPVGYEGSLPGSSQTPDQDPSTETCARVRPLKRQLFKKRKLLQMHNLHIASIKASKPSDVKCSCIHPIDTCPVCTGRPEANQPLPIFSTIAPQQRIALADPGYHPVLSTPKDITASMHLSTIAASPWFRPRVHKSMRGAHSSTLSRQMPLQAPKAKKHPTRLKRGRPPLSRKVKEREKEEESCSSTGFESRSRGRPSTESRRRQSYDIDNIVIPQSVAANTRPQILTYKEIITPKWRVLDMPEMSLNNGVRKHDMITDESEDEDISDVAVQSRHRRAEHRERSRYVRPRSRRQPEPGELPPPAPPPPPLIPPLVTESVRPYTPRQFPLREDTYMSMLSSMPDGYRQTSPETSRNDYNDDDDSSTISSPMSPTIFDGDDPDDAEWDPRTEKSERRKSAFR